MKWVWSEVQMETVTVAECVRLQSQNTEVRHKLARFIFHVGYGRNLRGREDEGDSKTTHNVTDEVLAVVPDVSDDLVAHEVEDTLLQVREEQIYL